MGSFIKSRIEAQNISYAEVCRRLKIKHPTIHGYFWQETLQTRTIWKLSHAIGYNLFTDLTLLLPEELQKANFTAFQETIAAQQQEIEALKREINIYKEIITKRI